MSIKLFEFMEFYEFYCEKCKTMKQTEAYQQTENEFKKIFGRNRYANYKSFRRVYERKIFNKK